jgi:hypothetical protein
MNEARMLAHRGKSTGEADSILDEAATRRRRQKWSLLCRPARPAAESEQSAMPFVPTARGLEAPAAFP